MIREASKRKNKTVKQKLHSKMKLKVLGSSSKGNCYILDNGKEALVLEAGVRFSEVQKAVDFDISRIQGCLISHEHGDHSAFVQGFLNSRINCYLSRGTNEKLKARYRGYFCPLLIEANTTFSIGSFKVIPFDVQHDAEEPFGYLIHHEEMGNVLFATDTYYLKYRFKDLSNLIIECNYDSEILDENYRLGLINRQRRDRTIKSHLSYQTLTEILCANDLSRVNNIVLIHLSESNSHAEKFRKGVEQITGKNTYIAERNLEINFNKYPF